MNSAVSPRKREQKLISEVQCMTKKKSRGYLTLAIMD